MQCNFQYWHFVIQLQELEKNKLMMDVKSESKKRDTFKNWPLMKNSQFLSNPHETHEVIIFIKFHKDWTKNVESSLMANFWTCHVFSSDFIFDDCELLYLEVDLVDATANNYSHVTIFFHECIGRPAIHMNTHSIHMATCTNTVKVTVKCL